jgi:hypothetical protein
MYSNGEVVPRGASYAAERRRTYDLQTVRDDEEVAGEVIAAQGRLTQRTLTNALAINLVAAEVQHTDPDHGPQYEYLATLGVARLGRILSGER